MKGIKGKGNRSGQNSDEPNERRPRGAGRRGRGAHRRSHVRTYQVAGRGVAPPELDDPAIQAEKPRDELHELKGTDTVASVCAHRRLVGLTYPPRCADCGHNLPSDALGRAHYTPVQRNYVTPPSCFDVIVGAAQAVLSKHHVGVLHSYPSGDHHLFETTEGRVVLGPHTDQLLERFEAQYAIVPYSQRLFGSALLGDEKLEYAVHSECTLRISSGGSSVTWRRVRTNESVPYAVLYLASPFVLVRASDARGTLEDRPAALSERTYEVPDDKAIEWDGERPDFERFDDGMIVLYQTFSYPSLLVNHRLLRQFWFATTSWFRPRAYVRNFDFVHYETFNRVVPMVGTTEDYWRVAAKNIRHQAPEHADAMIMANTTARVAADKPGLTRRGKKVATYLTTGLFVAGVGCAVDFLFRPLVVDLGIQVVEPALALMALVPKPWKQ